MYSLYRITTSLHRLWVHSLLRAKTGWLLALCIALSIVITSEASAEDDEAQNSAFSEGFKPVPGGKPQTDEVNASFLVISAYGMFAILFVGYLAHLGRQQAHLSTELMEMNALIEDSKKS